MIKAGWRKPNAAGARRHIPQREEREDGQAAEAEREARGGTGAGEPPPHSKREPHPASRGERSDPHSEPGAKAKRRNGREGAPSVARAPERAIKQPESLGRTKRGAGGAEAPPRGEGGGKGAQRPRQGATAQGRSQTASGASRERERSERDPAAFVAVFNQVNQYLTE